MRSDTYWRIADKKGKLPFLVLGPFGGSNSEKSKMYMGVHLYTGGTYNPGFTVEGDMGSYTHGCVADNMENLFFDVLALTGPPCSRKEQMSIIRLPPDLQCERPINRFIR